MSTYMRMCVYIHTYKAAAAPRRPGPRCGPLPLLPRPDGGGRPGYIRENSKHTKPYMYEKTVNIREYHKM